MPQAQILALIVPVLNGLIGLFKPFMEQSFLKTTNPLHDPFLRVVTVVGGMVGAVGIYLVQSPVVNATGFWSTLGAGLILGLTSVGLYHVATGQLTNIPAAQDLPPDLKNIVTGK